MDTYWARMIHKPRGPIVLVRVYSLESSEKIGAWKKIPTDEHTKRRQKIVQKERNILTTS